MARRQHRRNLYEPTDSDETDGDAPGGWPWQQDVREDARGARAGPLTETGDERIESGGKASPHRAGWPRTGARRTGGTSARRPPRAAVQEGWRLPYHHSGI